MGTNLKMTVLGLWLLLGWTLCKSTEDEIVAVVAVARHGARTIVYPHLSNITNNEALKIDWGKLTNVGKHQLYLVGRSLAQNYTLSKRIANFSNRPSDIAIRTSGLNRTVESAQALLSGLFAPGLGRTIPGVQADHAAPPIAVQGLEELRWRLRDAATPAYQYYLPIYTTTAVHDYLFSPHMECTRVAYEEKKMAREFGALNDKYNQVYIDLHERLKNNTNITFNLDLCYQLYDNIVAIEGNGGNLTVDIEPLRENLTKVALDDSLNKFLALELKVKLMAYPILSDMRALFEAIVNPQPNISTPKLALFQVSDGHIMSLHKLFKWNLTEPVPFASLVVFELHKTVSNNVVTYTVEGYYNGIKQLLENGLDKYEIFKTFIKDHTFADEDDFKENCYYDSSQSYDRDTYVALSIVLMLIFLVLWGSNWYILIAKKKKPVVEGNTEL